MNFINEKSKIGEWEEDVINGEWVLVLFTLMGGNINVFIKIEQIEAIENGKMVDRYSVSVNNMYGIDGNQHSNYSSLKAAKMGGEIIAGDLARKLNKQIKMYLD